MIDAIDRISENPNTYEIRKSDGSTEIVTITRKDNPIEDGTPINRELLMAMQGFIGMTTIFEDDGSITETNSKGEVMKTIFNSDGSIIERFISNGRTIAKTTYFDKDGTIREVMTS